MDPIKLAQQQIGAILNELETQGYIIMGLSIDELDVTTSAHHTKTLKRLVQIKAVKRGQAFDTVNVMTATA